MPVASILNTETNQQHTLDNLDPEIDLSGHDSNYSPVDVPGVILQSLVWTGNTAPARRLKFTLKGPDAMEQLEAFKDLQRPVPGKFAPAICRLLLGSNPPLRCVVLSVQATGNWANSDGGRFNQIKVTLVHREVPLEATVG